MEASSTEPTGILALQTVAMPADTNFNGDIFGGWLVARMDMAGGIVTRNHANSRVVTASIRELAFLKPVYVGDTVACYAQMLKIGRTSMELLIEVWSLSFNETKFKKVAYGYFTFVAINDDGKPQPVVR